MVTKSVGVNLAALGLAKAKGKGKNKYGAKPVTINGRWFASKKEGKRATELMLLERAGAIGELRYQVSFPLFVKDVLICTYIADFVYPEEGVIVVDDAKGFKTPGYKLKKKLMLAIYGIVIRET